MYTMFNSTEFRGYPIQTKKNGTIILKSNIKITNTVLLWPWFLEFLYLIEGINEKIVDYLQLVSRPA